MATEAKSKRTDEQELSRGYRKVRRGYVVSDKMDKTITIEVEDRVKHPLLSLIHI